MHISTHTDIHTYVHIIWIILPLIFNENIKKMDSINENSFRIIILTNV